MREGDELTFGEYLSVFTVDMCEEQDGTDRSRASHFSNTLQNQDGTESIEYAHRQDGLGSVTARAAAEMKLLGLRLLCSKKGLEVRTVDEDTPASNSTFPFSFGDIVVCLDGKDCRSADMTALITAANALGSAVIEVLHYPYTVYSDHRPCLYSLYNGQDHQSSLLQGGDSRIRRSSTHSFRTGIQCQK